jgi:hypothetical protein
MKVERQLLATVQSKSTGETYDIRRGADGVVYCACLGWRYSRLTPKSCKHVRAYLSELESNNGATMPQQPLGAFVPQPHVIPQDVVANINNAMAAARTKAKPSLADTLLDMAKKMERGQQIAVTVIVAKMREAAQALQAGAPLAAPPMPAFQPVVGQTRVIYID